MALPKRIHPDSIREAIVEVRYVSSLPLELLVGIFFTAFDDTYFYADRPLKTPVMVPGPVNNGPEINIQIGRPSILYNKKISIQFLPQSFVFSCLNQYIGWEDYQPEIEKALKVLHNTGKISSYTRIGLRYITEYVDQDLRQITGFDYRFGLPDVDSVAIAFKSEFKYEGKKAIVNLHNKLPAYFHEGSPASLVTREISRIDIDVFIEDLLIHDTAHLLHEIENVHDSEKRLFFGMLRADFLDTLNPEY